MNKSRFILMMSLLCLAFNGKSQDIEQVLKEKAWDWTGSVGANLNLYNVSGIPQRSNPFFWNIHAQMTGKIYGFELPFSFSVGQHDFSFSRPFLQAGISPSYKWARLHIGTRNMFFSPYTLAGHTFDGIGLELSPGKWRIGAMYGRFRRARVLNADIDPGYFNTLYRRSGYAARVGYGSTTSFIDFSYLYGKDDPNSLNFTPPENAVKPAENHVIGCSAGLQLASFIHLYADGAVSMFTRDQNSLAVEDFPTEKLAETFNVTLSSRINYAFKTGVDFKFRKLRLRVGYERIMPDFETMGAFFFANDRDNITIAPAFTLFKNRLSLNGNLGIQRNNLLGNRSETTKRLIGSANVNYFHPKGWGINANYTNFNVEQIEAAIALSDSVRIALVTTNFSVTPSYSWQDTGRMQSIILSGNYQQVNDRNPFTREFTNMNTTFFTANYTFQMLNTGWGINTGLNYNIIELAILTSDRYGATLGTTWTKPESKLSMGITGTYNVSRIKQERDGQVYTVNANCSFSPFERHSLSVFVNVLRNESEQFENYTEIYSGISYLYRIR